MADNGGGDDHGHSSGGDGGHGHANNGGSDGNGRSGNGDDGNGHTGNGGDGHRHSGDGGGDHGHGNSAPTIVKSPSNVTSTAQTEDVGVTAAKTLVGTGSFAFADVDRSDSHSISRVTLTANDNPLHIALGTLTASVTTDSTGGCSTGKVSWNYTVSDAAVQFLAAGQVVHETYQITLSDNHGGTVTQNVTVTITGTNDAPTIVASPTNVTSVAVTQHGSSATTTETGSGILAFADVDLSDTHSISKIALTSNDSPLHTALGTLTAAVSTDSTNGAAGKVTWVYSVSDAAAAFLAAGQVVHETYQITVADNHGGTVTQDITVTITGTNDAPVIVASPTSITSAAVTAHVSGVEAGTGTFAFADLDLADTHSISQVALTANDNPDGAALGALTASMATDSTGSGVGGKVAWSYSVNDATLQSLAAGQVVHETYQVTVADNHGGTTTQNVTVAITGTNAAPVIVASPSSVVSAAATAHAAGTEAGNGTFAFADVNLTDTHSVSQVALTANDNPGGAALGALIASVATDSTGSGVGGTVAWSYSVNDATLQSLSAGQIVHETYQVTVADNHGGIAIQNVTVTITGTNAAPVIVVSPSNVVAAAVTENASSPATVEAAGGTFAFSDVNLADTHTVSQIALLSNDSPLGAALGTLTASVSTDSTGTGSGGQVTWNYSVNDAAIQFLAAGQVVHETYQVTVADTHGGTATQNITVTITGTDEAPTIVASPANVTTLAVSAHASGTEAGTGSFAFADVDLTDTHTVSQIALISNDNPLGSALGSLSAVVAADTSGTGVDGQVTWSYSVDDASLQYLAAGQTVHETYRVTVADNHGGTVTQNVTVTITGTNEAPVIVASPSNVTSGAVTEVGAATTDTAGGIFAFADVNLTDTHTVSAVTLIANDNPGGTALGALIASIATDTTGSGSGGQVTWQYSVNDAAIQFLAAGQTVHETYRVTVADNHGGTTTQDVTVTITGSVQNHAPVIVASPANVISTAVTEHIAGSEAGSGSFAFADVDLTDTHTVSAVTLSANDNPSGVALGTLTASIATDTTGSGTGGQVTWNYGVDDAILQFLSAGQVVHETYQITLADNHGATTTQNVTVTITGTNEAPVIVASPSNVVGGAVTEHATGTEAAAGTFAFADVDLLDTHVVSGVTLTANDNPLNTVLGALTASISADTTGSGTGGQVTWNYSVDDAALQFLAANQTVHETYQVTIADNHGGTTTQNVTVTITGTNEAPMIVASPSNVVSAAVTAQAAATETGSGTFAFADVDLTDTHTITAVTLTANDSPLHAALGTLTASIAADSTGSGTGGQVTWNYSVDDAALKFLAAGQVVHETYQVTVADNHGGTTTQNVDVTITGTNEAPVIDASPSSVTSAALRGDGSSAATTETATGIFAFTDVNLADTHSVSQVTLISNDSPLGAALGTLTAAVTADSTGSGAGGQVTWSYSVTDAALQFLAAGQTVHETYQVTVTDNNGATTTQDVTVTLSEKQPPVAHDDFATTAYNTPVTVNVLANDTDPNPGDTISVIGVGAASHGSVVLNADSTLTYTPTAGFQGADTVSYTIADNHGLTATANATFIVGAFQHTTVGTDVFLQNHLIEVGVNAGGTYGSASVAPAGYSVTFNTGQISLNVDPGGFGVAPLITGDFALPGVPEDSITVGFNDGTNHNFTNDERVTAVGDQFATTTTDISSGSHLAALTQGSVAGALGFTQTIAFNADDTFITHTVTLTNTSGHDLNDVRFLRSVDPDQDLIFYGTFDTINSVLHNPGDGTGNNIAVTQATGPFSGVDYSLVSFDANARASATVHGVVNHDAFAPGVFSNPVNINTQADAQTNLDIDAGVLAAGQTVTKVFYETFNTPSDGNDLLLGNSTHHNLNGGLGNDIIIGSAGNDIIDGGPGDDKLYGGGGINTFVFDPHSGNDTIFDFQLGKDELLFTNGQGFSAAAPVNADFNGDGVIDTRVTLTDGSTITLLGVNVTDPRALLGTFVDGGVSSGGVTANASAPATTESTRNVITFSDFNVSDTHTVSQATLVSNDSPLQAALGTLAASLTTDTTGTGNGGQVTWNYSVNDAAIAFLAAGQVVHETYQVTLVNNLGQPTNQNVSVTITGTNDAPVIVASPANVTTGAVTEYGSVHGILPATAETASGGFAFSDTNLPDTHSLSPVALIANDSPLNAPLGTLTAALASDTTGVGTGGQVTWNYTVSDAEIAFLATGQTVHETYALTVNDNHGGSTTQDVTVTITGNATNFAPIAQNDLVSTALNVPVTVNVLANDFDQNIGDTISLVSVGAASHGLAVANPVNGTVLYTPTAGYQGADTFNYTISDNHGATATATATVIVGAFDHQQVGTDVFLENHLIEAGVNGGGSFGSVNPGPAGYAITASTGQIALNVDPGGFGVAPLTTGDFTLPGVPEDSITIGYNDGTNHNLTNDERVTAVGDHIATTTTDISSGTHLGAMTHGSADGALDFTQTIGFDANDTYITTTVTLINTSGHALNDARFLRSTDPDQDQIFHGTFDTINSVVHNPGDGSGVAATEAVGPFSGVDISYVSFDGNAVASATLPNVVNHDAFAAQVSSNPTNVNARVDAQTNMDIDFGAMTAGQTITKTFYTTFNTPSAGNDLLLGDNNNHNLSGGAGDDIIVGSTGNDVINGGTGNDKLYGGGGSNTFVFDPNSGNDTIMDFHVGTDHVFFTPGQGFSAAAPVNGDFNGDGVVDTKVTLTDGSTITLLGVTVTDPHLLL